MNPSENLEALQGLHRDLVALSEKRLPTIDRLRAELNQHLEEFKQLLDKKKKNDESRKKLANETVDIDNTQYRLNDDFKQQVVQIADELDLDEIQAAQLLLQGQERSSELDRSPIVSAVICFHQRRLFLLEILHLAFKLANEEEIEEEALDLLQAFVRLVTGSEEGRITNGAKFWRRCIDSMGDVESWLQRLAERVQRISVLNESLSSDATQITEFERTSLTMQHESLAALTTYLTKNSISPDDFRELCNRARRLDKHDIITIHYLPVLLSSISYLGSEEARLSTHDLEGLSALISAERDGEQWSLRNLHAATIIYWHSYTSGHSIKMLPSGTQSDKDAEVDRNFTQIIKALQDGAFHFTLSVAQDLRRSDWVDPVKKAIVDYLLQDAVKLPSDSLPTSESFQELLMRQYQDFCDALIAHMPDTLRRIRADEDEQRRNLNGRFQGVSREYQSHLERFFVIVSYAYDQDPSRAIEFWDNQDDYLYGFLQWAAKRQTTPRVAAFCELLRSISQDNACATAAHKFLLEEGTPMAGKLRRTGSLSWSQVYAELEYYATHLKDKPMSVHSRQASDTVSLMEQMVEPESGLMLECYLRLVSHLCTQSTEVRSWVFQNESNDLPTILFQLAGSNIESRLRAAAFATLTSLLTNKTTDVGEGMWTYLDHWIAGGVSTANLGARQTQQNSPSTWSEQMIFDLIASGFEESNTFVQLLSALLAPIGNDADLNDALPFPDNLGASYRAPGITSYVDFVIGRIFGDKSSLLVEPRDQHLLRLSCLDFIATGLSTFNEDLVLLANNSTQPVESAMRTNSLETYLRLHPFARIMDWMFNDKVLLALFAASHQDVEAVNEASSDSPLILSLTRSIQVMNLILKLQTTYLDIVRPLIKASTDRRPPVMHGAYGGFEDAVLNNLQLIVDLGLFCGTGHQDLIIASLSLLEKLSTSRKLTVSPNAGFGKRSDRSRLLSILEKDNEAERITRSLVASLGIDGRELEAGPESSGYAIKLHILQFLHKSLLTSPNRPSIAHLLLGFQCGTSEISISPDGPFAHGESLFHAVVTLSLDYRDFGTGTNQAWMNSIVSICLDVLQILWKSPMSCAWVMTELRATDYVFLLAQRQQTITANTLWDAQTIDSDTFLVTDAPISFSNALGQRAAFFDLFARELRVASAEGMSRLSTRLSAALLGTVTFPGEQSSSCPTALDFFDFMDIDIPGKPGLPAFDLLRNVDFSICKANNERGVSIYNISRAEEMVFLQRNELQKNGSLFIESEALRFDQESCDALLCLLAINQQDTITTTKTHLLVTWVKMITLAVQSQDFETKTRSNLSLQFLQLILPKLERAFATDLTVASELVTLSRTLFHNIDVSEMAAPSKEPQSNNDRLFQFFRTNLSGIISHVAGPELRADCYLNCCYYLRQELKSTEDQNSARHRLLLRAIKLAGDRTTDIICDDAWSGQPSCRLPALLVLGELVTLTNLEESKLMTEAFARVNFVGVLVDSIKLISEELSSSEPTDVNDLFTIYSASLDLLQRISQTRIGASQVLAAGFFHSVRRSGLFSADPDVGFDIESSTALTKFFDLLLSLLRIITACLLAKGVSNEQVKQQTAEFLRENRQMVVGVFKRHAAVGGMKLQDSLHGNKDIDLTALVDSFTLLISATGFLEMEEEFDSQRGPRNDFS